MTRRDILKLGAVTASVPFISACTPSSVSLDKSQQSELNKLESKDRVVVIGGGFAGLSVAKNIRLHNKDCEVLVFEPKNIFISCPYSNLWLGDIDGVKYEDLLFSPLVSAQKFGYSIVNDKVISINKKDKTVSTLNGDFQYSMLVIATGIEYDYSKFGLDKNAAKECYNQFPPSYSGGQEQLALKKKIENFMGGTFVVTVPSGSYRCPPAPYERACMIADYFKRNNINGKVLLIDSREKPSAKAKGFLSAFKKYHSDHLEYLPMTTIKSIDIKNKTIKVDKFDKKIVKYKQETIEFDDANIIPANKASKLLQNSSLEVTSTGWGRVKTGTFESLNDDNIYIVGDVLGEYPFPKSAQMADSCGTILGEQIAKKLKGLNPEYARDSIGNVCYSMVSSDTGIYVTHDFTFENNKVNKKVVLFEEDTNDIAVATQDWYHGITNNIFS